MSEENEEKTDPVYPYCGGCGLRFVVEPQILPAEAAERAESRRCHYCLYDEAHGRKPQPDPLDIDLI